MKNFNVNGDIIRDEDLTVVSGFGKCYKNAVPGAYFNGYSSGIIGELSIRLTPVSQNLLASVIALPGKIHVSSLASSSSQ